MLKMQVPLDGLYHDQVCSNFKPFTQEMIDMINGAHMFGILVRSCCWR